MSDSQSAPMVNHIHTTKQNKPDISTNSVKSETSINNMQSNSFINLIRKTCIKLMCQDVIKINDIRSKQTSRPLIQLKTLPGMHPTWLYDTGAALTCISMSTFRQIAVNSRSMQLVDISRFYRVNYERHSPRKRFR